MENSKDDFSKHMKDLIDRSRFSSMDNNKNTDHFFPDSISDITQNTEYSKNIITPHNKKNNKNRKNNKNKYDNDSKMNEKNDDIVDGSSMTKVCMTYDLLYIDDNGNKNEIVTDLCDDPGYKKNEEKDLDDLEFEISFTYNTNKNKKMFRKLFQGPKI